ncbi:MAG: Lrp/AsnC family transcriptional regulator [Solirubrobacterales bacterium]
MHPRSVLAPVELPEVDRKIIRNLQADGRRPYVHIAKDVGIDEKTVRRRTTELREKGIIDITTVTDPALLDYGAIALCGLTVDISATPSQVAAELARIDAVDYVVVATGRYDVLLEVLCRDSADLLRVIEKEIRAVPAIRTCETFPYLWLHYQQQQWDAAQTDLTGQGRIDSGKVLDPIDRKLVKVLNEDARAPFRQIADQVGISESQVRQRVTQLTGSGAVRVMAITNPFNLGFRRLAWLGINVGPGTSARDVVDRLSRVPSIAYLAVCAGRFDILAEAVCIDDRDLLRVLDRDIRPMVGVRQVESWVFLEAHYKRLRPIF